MAPCGRCGSGTVDDAGQNGRRGWRLAQGVFQPFQPVRAQGTMPGTCHNCVQCHQPQIGQVHGVLDESLDALALQVGVIGKCRPQSALLVVVARHQPDRQCQRREALRRYLPGRRGGDREGRYGCRRVGRAGGGRLARAWCSGSGALPGWHNAEMAARSENEKHSHVSVRPASANRPRSRLLHQSDADSWTKRPCQTGWPGRQDAACLGSSFTW